MSFLAVQTKQSSCFQVQNENTKAKRSNFIFQISCQNWKWETFCPWYYFIYWQPVSVQIYTASVCVSQDYIVDLFRGLIDRQEWSDSGSVSERRLKSYLLLFACFRNYTPCVTKATQLFNKWRDSDGKMRSGVMIMLLINLHFNVFQHNNIFKYS